MNCHRCRHTRRAILYGIGAILVYPFSRARAEILTGKALSEWIETIKNGQDSLCCSQADGRAVRTEEWEARGDHYYVRLSDGNWHKVEDWMLGQGPNKAGFAMLWTWHDGGDTDEDGNSTGPVVERIRCFMPGTLG